MDHEQTLLTITAMRRQEDTEYLTCDYFCSMDDDDDDDENDSSSSSSSSRPASPRSGCSSVPCDASCRQIMFSWMIKVVDFFPSMHRETVAYAIDYLDRFLQTPAGKTARTVRSTFQLAAIACLYTAVKLHEAAAVSPKFLEQLSRDEYTEDDLKQMEWTVLKALKWRLTTPTAVGFLRQYMDIVPSIVLDGRQFQREPKGDEEDDVITDATNCTGLRQLIFETAKFQTEVALGEYKYVTCKASTIAYCALSNALEAHLPRHKQSDRHSILWYVSEAARLDQHDLRHTRVIQRTLLSASSSCCCAEDSMGREITASSKGKSGRSSPVGHHSPRTVCK